MYYRVEFYRLCVGVHRKIVDGGGFNHGCQGSRILVVTQYLSANTSW